MNQRGFAPLLLPIAIIVILLAGGGAYYVQQKLVTQSSQKSKPFMPEVITASRSAEINRIKPSTRSATLSALPKPSRKPMPQSSASAIPTATPTEKPVPVVYSSPIPGKTTNHVTCSVYFDPQQGSVNQEIKLIYGAYFYYSTSDDYVTNVQWDWDGDQNWDTDLSINNQHLTHTYDKPGSYTVRMRLQSKQGLISEVCTKNLQIN